MYETGNSGKTLAESENPKAHLTTEKGFSREGQIPPTKREASIRRSREAIDVTATATYPMPLAHSLMVSPFLKSFGNRQNVTRGRSGA
jgi:hypothetical protein